MKNLIVAGALVLVLFTTSAAMAQTVNVTKRPADPALGFDVIVSVLDPMSPMGTAVIRLSSGALFQVRYLESDHQPGLTSQSEILYRVRRLG